MSLKFDDYDTRHYRTLEPLDGYARWSLIYDDGITHVMDLALLERVDIDWKRAASAVDIACGTGRIGHWLRERGVAIIDGVDLCEPMLAQARAKNDYRELRCEDLRDCQLQGPYDLATCSLACEHLEELGPIYELASRLVVRGGHFVHVAYHPAFLLRGIPTHFRDPSGEDIAITSHIHLFSDHVHAAHKSGWELADSHERLVDDALIEEHPAWKKHRGWPLSQLLAWRRQ